jgi:hypothetical protein
MLHQRFPQEKRFTAVFAGFAPVLTRKPVEIRGFRHTPRRMREKSGSDDGPECTPIGCGNSQNSGQVE